MIWRRQKNPFPPDKKYIIDRLLRLGTTLLAFLLVLYLIYHIGDGFQTKLETNVAVRSEADKTVTLETYVFRRENVLTAPAGTVRYHYDEYQKVEAEGTVATVYSSTSLATRLALSRIDLLDRQIELLTESAARAQLLTNESATSTAIAAALASLRFEVDNGRYSMANTKAEDFYLQLSRRELQQSAKNNYALEIAELAVIRTTLADTLGSSSSILAGKTGGYFTRSSDGYEDIFDYQSVMSMGLTDFSDMLLAAEKRKEEGGNEDSRIVGKLVSGYQWYAVARADRTVLEKFDIGDVTTVSFPDNENENVRMELVRTVAESGSKDVLLIFSCNQMPDDFVFTRRQNMTFTFDHVEGLKVNRSAIRKIEGHSFVYILHGAQVQLRAVNILDRVGGYYYVATDSPAVTIEQGNYQGTYRGLAENDRVIVYGVGLSDGHIFN